MRYIPIILGLVLSLSCARTKVVKEVVVEEEAVVVYDVEDYTVEELEIEDTTEVIEDISEPSDTVILSQEESLEEIKVKKPEGEQKEVMFSVQIGAMTMEMNAIKVRDRARKRVDEDVYVECIPPHYKVRIGKLVSLEQAKKLKLKLLSLGYGGVFIVKIEKLTPQVSEEVSSEEVLSQREEVQEKKGKFFVQVGAFVRKKWAEEMVKELSSKIEKIPLIRKELPYYKVVIIGFTDRIEAEEMRDRLNMEFGYFEVFVIEE